MPPASKQLSIVPTSHKACVFFSISENDPMEISFITETQLVKSNHLRVTSWNMLVQEMSLRVVKLALNGMTHVMKTPQASKRYTIYKNGFIYSK